MPAIYSLIFLLGLFGGGNPLPPTFPPKITTSTIDTIWAGTAISFDTQQIGDDLYIGYYGTNRHLKLARYRLCDGTLTHISTPIQFEGWDSHNDIDLAADTQGNLHIAGNMHASPLIYGTLDTTTQQFTLHNEMTGQKEQRVTYPQFMTDAQGTLYFLYRDGGSGNGQRWINRYDNGKWVRHLEQPLFFGLAGRGAKSVSAYPSDLVRDSKGFYHMAWVWRSTPDVRTNCCLHYAKSVNLRDWLNHDGQFFTAPIHKMALPPLDPVAENHGLLNNQKLALIGNSETPVITYLKYDDAGVMQLFAATPINNTWQIKQLSQWSSKWEPSGKGAIKGEIGYSKAEAHPTLADSFLVHYRHNTHGSGVFVVTRTADHTLTVQTAKRTPRSDGLPFPMPTPNGHIRHTHTPTLTNTQCAQKAALFYTSLPSSRDQPKDCDMAGNTNNSCLSTLTLSILP